MKAKLKSWFATAKGHIQTLNERYQLFPGTPAWVVLPFIAFLAAGFYLVIDADPVPFGVDTLRFVVGLMGIAVPVAAGACFCIYRARYLRLSTSAATDVYELRYYDKVVGSIAGHEIAAIDLAQLQSPRRWMSEAGFAGRVLWAWFAPLPTVTIKLFIALCVVGYLGYDATYAELADPTLALALVQVAFMLALVSWMISFAVGYYRTAIKDDLPRVKAIVNKAGVTGYDPAHIEITLQAAPNVAHSEVRENRPEQMA